MPRKGYRSITLKEPVLHRLEDVSFQMKCTVPRVIEHMLDTLYPEERPR